VLGPDPRNLQKLRIRSGTNRGHAPKRRKEGAFERGTDSRQVVEGGLESTGLAEALARPIREAVGLVTKTREEKQRGGVTLEGDGILLAGEVDAVDQCLRR